MLVRALLVGLVVTAIARAAEPDARSGVETRADHAVILLFHHVATDTPPATSISPERFEALLELIEREGFRVLGLPELVARLREGAPVPDNAVAITFDDGYRSVHDHALPMLAARNWPFTVFVNRATIGGGVYMDLAALRGVQAAGATIANHGDTHASFATLAAADRGREFDGFDAIALSGPGVRRDLFAWPYGEFAQPAQRDLAARGWIGFGQQSGAVGPASDFTALPRHPISASMSDADVLMRLRSRPLPLRPSGSVRHVIAAGGPSPVLEFTLGGGAYDPTRLGCFTGTGQRLSIDRSNGTYAVSMPAALAPGRHRTTCTAPGRDGEIWWYSHPWIVR